MTLRPKRGDHAAPPPGGDDFHDPLGDYARGEHADDLERSLAEETVAAMKTRPFKTIGPGTTIDEAMRTMVDMDIACLLVTEGDRLVGIVSERDVLRRVAEGYPANKDEPVSGVMTPQPVAIYETDTPAKALSVMVIGGFRHVPILDVDDKVVGILGPRRVTAYLQKYLARA